MIYVSVCGEEHPLHEIDEEWVRTAIERRRRDRLPVFVRFRIDCPGINAQLCTPGGSAGGGGRPPCGREVDVFEMWRRCGLTSADFRTDDVIRFLKYICQLN